MAEMHGWRITAVLTMFDIAPDAARKMVSHRNFRYTCQSLCCFSLIQIMLVGGGKVVVITVQYYGCCDYGILSRHSMVVVIIIIV